MTESEHRNESTRGPYTFGDNAVASIRLQRLADLFRPSLETSVTEHLLCPIRHLLDLGCGPGHTTRALAAVPRAKRVTGLDKSPSFIEEAARTPVANVVYQVGDVNRSHDEVVPDVPPADALYSRFLLTHLPNPQQALSMWASYVTDGAVCLRRRPPQ
jgi:trans-aconitate 2-methyltransferase